ncbi:formate--phosphoribosylaminoimidazolecarboxamide ligase [Candidatus Peregrinibacteria bacterium]|nr:formate--phosphoribosylaminoimidazolecarboxamide ligase [Candidatus Peregrinibacteria bacterium]
MAHISEYSIATLGSHTALQILKGAKDEGFRTICICTPKTREPYEYFGVADEILEVNSFADFFSVEDDLIKKNAIVIPHGSFVSYVGPENMMKLRTMHFGTKGILEYESDRTKEREWLLDAGLNLPKIYTNPNDIDRPVIVKFHGARGGLGYFVAKNTKEFEKRIREYPPEKEYVIQEYVVGVPMYIHYFSSPLTGELEVLGFDKRYESNADSIGRISASDQLETDIKTSYTITGNIPLVIRESLLPYVFKMGRQVVEASKKLAGKGLFGPFCIETIMDPNIRFFVFEISARIVAGTNPYINGSPYSWLKYNEPMSTGRRIAREIKLAIEQGRLEEVLG